MPLYGWHWKPGQILAELLSASRYVPERLRNWRIQERDE